MIGHIIQANRLKILLGTACIALASIIGLQIGTDEKRPVRAAPVQVVEEPEDEEAVEIEVADFDMNPRSDYDEVVERPLFHESRRPVVAEEAEPAPDVALSAIRLVGILDMPPTKVVLIESDGSPRIERVPVGEKIGAWSVEEIARDRVILVKGEQRSEIKIKDRAPPPVQDQRPPPRAKNEVASVPPTGAQLGAEVQSKQR
ncbi:hypothetical protein [Indioceanicola profundi]|uniref:hypothetical protein n=1 Tax=Indioceanicola profundi TaxID=2220096 RepID=UPI000E6AA7B0|nr:hypothetical protein [Indioceanicola profundi]